MAQSPTLLKLFVTGQGIFGGVTNYISYSADLDSNFTVIETTFDDIVGELNAIQGSNAVIGVDLVVMNDPSRDFVPTEEPSGLLGIGSYSFTINTGSPDTLSVTKGSAMVEGTRVSNGSPALLTPSGADGLRFLQLNSQGLATLTTTAQSAGQLDLYVFDWVLIGTTLSNPRRLANVMNDGDDYENERKRKATGNIQSSPSLTITFPTTSTIVRNTGSWTTDGFNNGDPITVTGSRSNAGTYTIATAGVLTMTLTGTPLTIETDTTGTVNTIVSTGVFRFHDFDQIHERFEDIENLLAGQPTVDASIQISFPDGTEALPGIAFGSDLSVGIFLDPTSAIGMSKNLRIQDGLVTDAGLSFENDIDTGIRLIGTGNLAILTGGVDAIDIGTSQQVTCPQQAAGYVSKATQDITTGTGQVITFDSELFDRQNQHTTGTVTIGSVGEAGIYQITVEGRVDEAAGGVVAASFALQIRQGTTVRSTAFLDGVGSGGTNPRIHGFNAAIVIELSNSDTFDVFATQGSGSTVAFTSVRMSWVKVA